MSEALSFFAVCPKGVEEVLAGEIRALGLPGALTRPGGVAFAGSLRDLYGANLWLRTANRVLWIVSSFDCPDEESLYQGALAVEWERWMTPARTLAVDANIHHSIVQDARFAALKVKDAVCDRFRERTGERPSVDAGNPDLRINVHIANDRCAISLDSSGKGLHQRGYRKEAGKAPLRETLAAALVDLASWDGNAPLADPMCGSGTIGIEAALKAARAAPGLGRQAFGFQRWLGFEAGAWRELLDEARSLRRAKIGAPIFLNDRDERILHASRVNARSAGVEPLLRWSGKDAREWRPPVDGPGVVLSNPPYGERLKPAQEEELGRFYKESGDALQTNWAGWTAYLFTGSPLLSKRIWMKTAKRWVLWNGPIECRLLKYEIRERAAPAS